MAAPAWVQASPTGSSFSGTTSVGTTHAASGIVSGHVAVWLISCSTDSTGLDITWPAGWNEIADLEQTSDFHQFAAWRRCDGSENGTTATATLSAAGSGTSRMGYWSGCLAAGTPVEGVASDQGTSATASCSAITTAGADRRGLHLISARRTTATEPPTGWTERIEIGANTSKVCFEDRDATLATKATEPATTRALGGSADWITTALALRPTEVEVLASPASCVAVPTALAVKLEARPAPAIATVLASAVSIQLAAHVQAAATAVSAPAVTPTLAPRLLPAVVALGASPGARGLAVGLAPAQAASLAPAAAVALSVGLGPATVAASATALPSAERDVSAATVAFLAMPVAVDLIGGTVRWLDTQQLGLRRLAPKTAGVRTVVDARLVRWMRESRSAAVRLVHIAKLRVQQ